MIQDIVIISNSLIMAATLIATLYRIVIEREQVKLLQENTKYRKQIKAFRIVLNKEKDEILKMTPKEILDMIDEVWKED
jgi:RNA polymerase-interacting CarD/CdnL/TRCF family regulator